VNVARSATAIASEIGAKNLLIPLTQLSEVTSEKARDLWIHGIRSCVKSAEDHEVAYALENVNKPFARTGEQLASIVDEINSPYVKVYYDPAKRCSCKSKSIRGYSDPWKAYKPSAHQGSAWKAFGEGNMDLPSVLAALKDVEYDDWLILETPATENPIEAGLRNLCFLRGILSRLRMR